jgi:hypothetical protein
MLFEAVRARLFANPGITLTRIAADLGVGRRAVQEAVYENSGMRFRHRLTPMAFRRSFRAYERRLYVARDGGRGSQD